MADPHICLNCKHWGDLTRSGSRNECTRIAEKRWNDHEAAEPAKAVVESRSYAEDAGCFYTAYDFGCVLFEAKDA